MTQTQFQAYRAFEKSQRLSYGHQARPMPSKRQAKGPSKQPTFVRVHGFSYALTCKIGNERSR